MQFGVMASSLSDRIQASSSARMSVLFYRSICNTVFSCPTAKPCIPTGWRKNHLRIWKKKFQLTIVLLSEFEFRFSRVQSWESWCLTLYQIRNRRKISGDRVVCGACFLGGVCVCVCGGGDGIRGESYGSILTFWSSDPVTPIKSTHENAKSNRDLTYAYHITP